MRNVMPAVLATLLMGTISGCGPAPAPVPPHAPPPPPVVVAPPPPVQPVTEAPAAKPMPPALPPELIAKADELVAFMKQLQADAAKSAANPADGLDAAVAAVEQQARLLALANELSPLLSQLTIEQQAEFRRRYQSQLGGLVPTIPTAPPVEAIPEAKPAAP